MDGLIWKAGGKEADGLHWVWWPAVCTPGGTLSYVGFPGINTELQLLNIFINELDDGIESTLTEFVDDTKPGDEVDTSEGWDILQRDLGRLEEWACKNTEV